MTDRSFLRASFLFSYPVMKRAGCDDCGQLVDHISEWLAVLQPLGVFVGFGMNLSWDALPQDPVFFCQIEDIFGQQADGGQICQCQ